MGEERRIRIEFEKLSATIYHAVVRAAVLCPRDVNRWAEQCDVRLLGLKTAFECRYCLIHDIGMLHHPLVAEEGMICPYGRADDDRAELDVSSLCVAVIQELYREQAFARHRVFPHVGPILVHCPNKVRQCATVIVFSAQEYGKSLRDEGLGDPVRAVGVDSAGGETVEQVVTPQRSMRMIEDGNVRISGANTLMDDCRAIEIVLVETLEIGENVRGAWDVRSGK